MKIRFILFILCVLLFVPGLGLVHLFDWDEINFAESAREMIVTNNYSKILIDYKPFWEKPPFFIWCQVLSMKAFGINEFGARFPNALVGLFSILSIFSIGNRLKGESLGLIWVLTYLGSLIPHLYFKSGIIDPMFNLFIFLSINELTKITGVYTQFRNKYLISILSGLIVGFAILTKGPVAGLILGLTTLVYGFMTGFRNYLSLGQIFTIILAALIPISVWLIPDMLQNGTWFLETFIDYQVRLFKTEDAGHGGPFYFHFLVLLLGCFPASIFVFSSFKKQFSDKEEIKHYKLWMQILLFVVLILFSIVKTKIIHYSSLCWFPLTFLAAYSLEGMIYEGREGLKSYQVVLTVFIGFLLSALIALFPFIDEIKIKIIPKIADEFAKQNIMADVYWSKFESLIGVFYFAFIVWSLLLMNKIQTKIIGVIILFSASIGFIQLFSYVFIPKIEQYSQKAAIDFFESKKDEICIVEPRGYKSYAHLFYTKKRLPLDSSELDLENVYHGNVNQKVYYISKIGLEREMLQDTLNKKIGEKNGFVFYERIKFVPQLQPIILDSVAANKDSLKINP